MTDETKAEMVAQMQREYDQQVEFARQLATLNAHPERWALVEQYMVSKELVWTLTVDKIGFREFADDTYMRMICALVECGLGDIGVDDARALLAARETESEGE